MSLRLEMLQVARLAPKVLGDSTELVRDFLLGQQNEDGGFKDRVGKSDLYYTIFGLDSLLALQTNLPGEHAKLYLESFEDGPKLDFVHLCCLARAWTAVSQGTPDSRPADLQRTILKRIESYRSEDGGYNPIAGSHFGTAYGAFLAFGAYQDLKSQIPEPLRLVQALKFLETEDGAWANEHNLRVGSTNATAAAVTVLRNLQIPINQSVGDWLLAHCHRDGGFLAALNAPIPDLLSTATALHALAGLQVSFESVREKCFDYIDTLWTNEGSFYGQWSDDALDCEYTFYGLLALGHLSL